jgi:FixJ family two-component response regulator
MKQADVKSQLVQVRVTPREKEVLSAIAYDIAVNENIIDEANPSDISASAFCRTIMKRYAARYIGSYPDGREGIVRDYRQAQADDLRAQLSSLDEL